MTESDYTTSIHKKLKALGGIFCWKIRDDYAGGVPDAFYRRILTEAQNQKPDFLRPLWVEYKFIKTFPKRPSTLIVPNLSVQQRMWLDMTVAAGEQAWVIVGFDDSKKGLVLLHDEWDGITAEDARLRLLSRDEIAGLITAAVSGVQ